jgi:hypothetical protein
MGREWVPASVAFCRVVDLAPRGWCGRSVTFWERTGVRPCVDFTKHGGRNKSLRTRAAVLGDSSISVIEAIHHRLASPTHIPQEIAIIKRKHPVVRNSFPMRRRGPLLEEQPSIFQPPKIDFKGLAFLIDTHPTMSGCEVRSPSWPRSHKQGSHTGAHAHARNRFPTPGRSRGPRCRWASVRRIISKK